MEEEKNVPSHAGSFDKVSVSLHHLNKRVLSMHQRCLEIAKNGTVYKHRRHKLASEAPPSKERPFCVRFCRMGFLICHCAPVWTCGHYVHQVYQGLDFKQI